MKYFNNQHKYNSLDEYLKQTYNSKVFKISLNGNFTCPNRDGALSRAGCIFCSEKGSGDFAGDPKDDLKVQFNEIKKIMHKKWQTGKYIAYFQANTNTYGSIDKLKKLYETAITLDDNIVALAIGTRPDCLSEEILDYLEDLNKRIPVWIELGLQSSHPNSMKYLNLCYTLEQFEKSVYELRKRNIDVIVHIINGIPKENKEMMLDTIKYLNQFDIQGIKIHSLFVLENTILGTKYNLRPFKILSLEDYVDIVCDQIALLRDDIIIHRINGDAPRDQLIEPKWSLKKFVVMNNIDKEMHKRNYYQGINYYK